MANDWDKNAQSSGRQSRYHIRLTPEEERRVREWRERRARRTGGERGMPVQGETHRYGNREIPDHEHNEYGWSEYPGQPFSRGYGEDESRPQPEDWEQNGPFSGMGPKGYERPDSRIYEEVCERLTRHGQIDARDVTVEVAQGEVTLRGSVDSRRTKRMVEDAIESVAGVRDVHNELRIGAP